MDERSRKVPSRWDHVYYTFNIWRDDYGIHETRDQCDPSVAKVVSSQIVNSCLHTVMLDIDIPVTLLPSSTSGHSHLYIDQPVSWWRYRRLLKQLMLAGIIEKGYYKASLARKATHLRPPWVTK